MHTPSYRQVLAYRISEFSHIRACGVRRLCGYPNLQWGPYEAHDFQPYILGMSDA
jgi:hypothetical protein